MDLIEDVYENEFRHNEHINFVGREAGTNPVQFFVVSVLTKTSPYQCLKTQVKNYQRFEISLPLVASPEEILYNHLIEKYPQSGLFLVKEKDFPNELAQIELKHMQRRLHMKVGVVYCKAGQATGPEMFTNTEADCSPGFWEYINSLGTKFDIEGWTRYRGDMRPPGTAWFGEWNGVEIVFHIAPIMSAEEKRRLIGNDICMLFYFDVPVNSAEPTADAPAPLFQLTGVDTFGEVPQCFAVVQPNSNKEFRLGFFSKINLIPHLPEVPSEKAFYSMQEANQIILTKLHNGMIKTSQCPPLNRLFIVPRRERLKEMCEKLPEPLVPGNIDKTKVRTRTKKSNSITEMWLKKPAFVIESKLKEKEEALVAILDRKDKERGDRSQLVTSSPATSFSEGVSTSNNTNSFANASETESQSQMSISSTQLTASSSSIPITIVAGNDAHVNKPLPKPAQFKTASSSSVGEIDKQPLRDSSSPISTSPNPLSQSFSELTNLPKATASPGNESPTSPSTPYQSGLNSSQTNVVEAKLAQLQQQQKDKEQPNATNPAIKRIVSGTVPEPRKASTPNKLIASTDKQKKEAEDLLKGFGYESPQQSSPIANGQPTSPTNFGYGMMGPNFSNQQATLNMMNPQYEMMRNQQMMNNPMMMGQIFNTSKCPNPLKSPQCEIILGQSYVTIGTKVLCGRCHQALIEFKQQKEQKEAQLAKEQQLFQEQMKVRVKTACANPMNSLSCEISLNESNTHAVGQKFLCTNCYDALVELKQKQLSQQQ